MFKPSLDSILSTFNKTIQQLEKLTEANRNKQAVNLQKISALNTKNISLEDEASRADSVKKKLLDIVS